MDLEQALAMILPRAVQWAQKQERHILSTGRILTPDEIKTAADIGVSHPQKIRLKTVSRIPAPQDSILAQAGFHAGINWANMFGLTLYYGIFIREGTYDLELLAHECRHVYQYEQRGSIEVFLQEYLQQVLTFGYEDAPLEEEARSSARGYILVSALRLQ